MATRDDWLETIAVPDQGFTTLDPWELLRLNNGFDGPTRLAIGRDGVLHVRSDLFIDSRSSDDSERVALPLDEVLRFAGEAGWPSVARTSAAEIALDRDDPHARARVTLGTAGAVRVVAPLVEAEGLSAASRSAMGFLLLRLSAVVRAVKGVVLDEDGTETVGIAAACGPPASAEAVNRLFSALAVSCRLAGREVRALADDTCARTYLHIHSLETEAQPCLQQP